MSLTFYDFKHAPSPRRIRILLALKNINHKAIEVDMMKAEQLTDAYKAINPECTIPTLKLEDGTTFTNVAAMNAYLEATYPEPSLMGTTALEKAEIAGWQSKIEQELGMAIPNALRNSNPAFKDRALPGPINYPQIPELAERGLTMLSNFMDKLDKHLDGRDYIAANQLSVADIAAVSFIDFTRVVGNKITEKHPHLLKWRTRLKEIDAFTL
ncbi:glutathione S-transferase family protein [Temperatibacter marinus]|uniref:Glutathione S-transferase family protein n=1 Tax=Temperatibacter marinus TaxID=1456591 RepID=A0AA52H993_9PROT|nr:glutathione S-transferase family protein [Temperatibacter marinus]WND01403.1 glutathione S-transferase family protein [Temperatibacter marinus]